jgi:transposase
VLGHRPRRCRRRPPTLRAKQSYRLVPSPSLASDVRRFVRERSEKRERTVAEDVLDLVVRLGYMSVVDGNEADRRAAIRCVQRYLAKEGYKRGKRKGATYRLSSANAAARDEYVLRMAVDPATTNRRKVYLDQSYVHHNYSSHNDSLYDPTDPLTTKAKHKGRRYCFSAAIIGDDPSVPPDEQVGGLGAHIIPETIHIFEGGKATNDPTMGLHDRLAATEDRKDRLARLASVVKTGKTTKDYHGMFVHEYIVVWMEILFDVLDAKGFRECIIVLDNAKYHKVLPEHVPRKKDSKQKLVQACEQYNLPVHARDTKAILWDKLQLYIRLNVVPVIVEMARERGHDVIYTPPRFSDLQPIEYVWAMVKGIAGRQYTSETTFAQVLQRLEDAFEQVSPQFVRNCIKRTNQDLYELLSHVEEDQDDADGDSEQSSDSSSSDTDDEV